MNFKNIKFEEKNKIAFISVNRPEKLNALNLDVFSELKEILLILTKSNLSKIRGMILKGEGEKAFIAGADIKQMSQMSAEQGESFGKLGQEITLLIESLSFPVIACVDGYALGGGCEMAMSCDYIFATQKSLFGQPEVHLGLIPGFGGCVRLPQYVGLARAKELIFSGRKIRSYEAQEMGLVQEVFSSAEEMIKAAEKSLYEIFKNSSHAVSICKKTLNSLEGKTTQEQMTIESEGFKKSFLSSESEVGMRAFIEKKDPGFC